MARTAQEIPKVKIVVRHREQRTTKAGDVLPACKYRDIEGNTPCDCPRILQWSEGGKLYRPAAPSDWRAAEDVAKAKQAELESKATGLPSPVATPHTSVPQQPQQGRKNKTVEEAISLFLETKTEGTNKLTKEKLTDKHVETKLQPLLEGFQQFANNQGLVYLNDIETEHVLAWRRNLVQRNGEKYAQSTKAKLIHYLTGFFNFCVRQRWMEYNPATEDVQIAVPDTQKPKALTDAQVEQLFAAISKLPKNDITDRLPAVLLLMRWTGLSLRDAVTLKRSLLMPNGNGFWKVETSRAKTNKPVYCSLTGDLAQKILASSNSTGTYLFVQSVPIGERQLDNLMQAWGRTISRLGEIANIKDENGDPLEVTSHWFRHTFVRWCLDNNISTENIAMLIGDNVATVAKHYQGWIEGRQDILTVTMKKALTEKQTTASGQ